MIINPSFWQNKTVLVTGHTGFKGSWLTLWLQKLGANVVGVSLPTPPSSPSLFELTPLASEMTASCHFNIKNQNDIHALVSKWKPSIIFHLAAQPIVRESYRNPHETFSTNILGTLHLLEVIREHSFVKVFINITTDKCYIPRNGKRPLTEKSPLGGHDPYSSSKACAELITQSYYKAFWNESESLGVATLRTGNVLGGGDWGQERLFPDFFRSLERGEALKLRYPNAIRPWQHILEALACYLVLGEKLWQNPKYYSGPYNIGPPLSHHRPVVEVIEMLGKYFSLENFYHVDPLSTAELNSKSETPILRLNGEKARKRLKIHSVWDLEKTIMMVAKWFQAWQSGANVKSICLEHITQYEKDLHFSKKTNI